MAKIHLDSKTSNEDQALRRDFFKLEQAINLSQDILNLESRSEDPTALGNTDGKIQIWYRSDLQQIRFNDNGTTYKLQASVA